MQVNPTNICWSFYRHEKKIHPNSDSPFSILSMVTSSCRSRVLDLGNQDIASADISKLIHNKSDILPLDHGADSNPTWVFEAVDRGRALAWRDGSGLGQLGALDVVGAQNVLLGGWTGLAGTGRRAGHAY